MAKLRADIVPVTPFQQNCTLLYDAESLDGVVVDPGGDVAVILQAISDKRLAIGQIWLTHGHLDHAGGADELRGALGVEVIGPHEADRPLLERIEIQATSYGLTGMKSVVPDRYLTEGETLSIGEHRFAVFHTPGHAPGHVIFYNEVQRFAHLGDVLFRGSIGRTDLPGGNHDQLLDSIKTKVLPLGDDVGFICGHGPGGRIGEERRSNPFLTGL